MQTKIRIFDLFAKMIRDVPARAVLRALDLECTTLEDDMKRNRSAITLEVFSILYFGQFVRLAKLGKAMCVVESFPPDHVELYKETIVRLVDAKELPPTAILEFDRAFTVGI